VKSKLLPVLAVVFIVGLALTIYFVAESRTPDKETAQESEFEQVNFINSLISGNMETDTDGTDWTADERGIYYRFYGAVGEKADRSTMQVWVDVKEANNLENIKKIAAHYFPEKGNEIYSAVQARYDAFKNYDIITEEYNHASAAGRSVNVSIIRNAQQERYVVMVISSGGAEEDG